MDIEKTSEGSKLVLKVSGRLETLTAPQLESEIKNLKDEVAELVFDFAELEYISSAGLRLILLAQKTMKSRGGTMKILGANDSVMKVFKITGFASILSFA